MESRIPASTWTRILNSGPVVLVSTTGPRGPNVCTVAWNMPVSKTPPRFALTIGRGHLTFENLIANGELVINVPTVELLDAVMVAGTVSGRDEDKWERAELSTMPLEGFAAPGVAECCASLGCRLVDAELARSRSIVIVEALTNRSAPGLMREDGTIDTERYRLIHHQGGSRFYSPGFGLLAR